MDDTIVAEEAFNTIMEDPYDNLMLITEFNYETINPVLRQPLFLMPGKRWRPASKYYHQLVARSRKCMCKYYSYNIAREVLFREVDRLFERMLSDFYFRMQKSQVFKLDAKHLEEMVEQDLQTKNLFNTDVLEDVARYRVEKAVYNFWLRHIKRYYLTITNVQDDTRVYTYQLNNKEYITDKVLLAMKYLNEHYYACIVCLYMHACGGSFSYKIDQQLQELTDRLKCVVTAASKYRKILQGRFHQHKNVLEDIAVARSVATTRPQSLANSDIIAP